MTQGELFAVDGRPSPCCHDRGATWAPPYLTASGCFQEPWVCPSCGTAGLVSTRAGSVTGAQVAAASRVRTSRSR